MKTNLVTYILLLWFICQTSEQGIFRYKLIENGVWKRIILSDSDQCVHNICRACLHRTDFSEDELDQVRKWIQKKQLDVTEKYGYRLPTPCEKITVRKDFYCLTETEQNNFIDVIRKLYLDGTMAHLADLHSRYWPHFHKAGEFFAWHKYFVHVIDKELQRYDPSLLMPSWVCIAWKWAWSLNNLFILLNRNIGGAFLSPGRRECLTSSVIQAITRTAGLLKTGHFTEVLTLRLRSPVSGLTMTYD